MKIFPTLHRDESGVALILVLFLMTLLLTISITLPEMTSSTGTRISAAVQTNNALQAAEAGLNVYIADLTEDTGFYLDYIAAGEARRTYNSAQYPTTGGANANANVALSPSWSRTATWTYPSDVTTDPGWRTVGTSTYQYLLEIFPDSVHPNNTRVIAFGRPTPSTAYPASAKQNYRAMETYLTSLSLSDFQMLSANSISYGSTATTTGWVYATFDDSGNAASINHAGTATADLFTENTLSSYSGSTNLVSPARKYASNSSPSIRTVINEPITFSALRQSPQIAPIGGGQGAIQLNAASNGITLNPTTNIPNAWWLKFQSNGTVQVYSCMKATTTNGGTTTYYPVENRQPTCTLSNTYTLSPTGEDIYSTEDLIMSGVVNGQVTLYSAGGGKASSGDGSYANGDVIVADNISYATPGSNVLGAVAAQSVIIACWQPQNNLSWTGATLSLNGRWESDYDGTLNPACTAATKSSMTFAGSTATYGGGSMGGFAARTYNYDSSLRYLPPPDYPQIPAAIKIMYERQVGVQ